MHIRMSKGFERRLEKQLTEFEERIDSQVGQKPILPHKEWAKPKGVPGLISEFARGRTVHLTKLDFAHGTVRVLVPCKIVLCESIVFNPNPGYLGGNPENEIDPNRDEHHDWLPYRGQTAYLPLDSEKLHLPHGGSPSRAYHLGFFAAITVEHGEGTIIDLNGFRLSCHPDFALQQRFHALIELANQPFMAGQGPSDFGGELRSAKKVWIRNGTIGLSAHHGIHGNSMQDVLISDVTFRDYEVAAISLNGGRRIVIRDCQLEGTLDRVPVLSAYSGSRFARLVGKNLLNQISTFPGYSSLSKSNKKAIDQAMQELEQAIRDLNPLLDETFNLVKRSTDNGDWIKRLKQIDPLFRNPHYIDPETGRVIFPAEANPYGIAIHSRGVLVNAFLCNGSKMGGLDDLARAFECTDITLERVNIAKTRGIVREVLALAAEDQSGRFNVISDAAGAVIRFFPNDTQLPGHCDIQPAEMTDDGAPSPTKLGRVQFGIARLERALVAAEVVPASRMLTKNIPAELIAWADGDGSRIVLGGEQPNDWKLVSSDGGATVLRLKLRANGDFMHHVNKGALGLFIQAVDGLRINRVIVAGVENIGLPGSEKAGPYQGPSDGGHGSQSQQLGYSGADARGIYVGACSNVCSDRIQAHGITSRYGHATGIEFAGGTEHAQIHSAVVGNVTAGAGFMEPLPEHDTNDESPPDSEPCTVAPTCSSNSHFPPGREFQTRYPNTAPEAFGLMVDATTRNIAIENFQVTGTMEQPGRRRGSKIRIESRLNKLSPGH